MFTLQAIVNGQPPEAETSSQVLNIKLQQGFICVQVRLGVMTIAASIMALRNLFENLCMSIYSSSCFG